MKVCYVDGTIFQDCKFDVCPWCHSKLDDMDESEVKFYSSLRKPTAKNIEAITSFLPFFESGTESDFFTTAPQDDPTVINLTPKIPTQKVLEFHQALYDEGLWVNELAWKIPLERINKDVIEYADIFTIQIMITTIIRGDRFNDILLAHMIERG